MTASDLLALLPLLLVAATSVIVVLAAAVHRSHAVAVVLTLAGLAGASLVLPFFGTTVCAIARTASKLKAMGLAGAFLLRMLSRRAFFFEGFSMGGEGLAVFAGGAGLATFALIGADGFFFSVRLATLDAVGFFLFLAMGILGGGKKN